MLEIDAKSLSTAIRTVSPAIAKKTPMPVLEHVLIESDGECVVVSANDTAIGIATRLDAPGCGRAAFTAPGRDLAAVLSRMKENVKLDTDGGTLSVNAGSRRFRFETFAPDDFPAMPPLNSMATVSMPAEDLKGLLEAVAYAAGKDDVRYVLNGILLELTDGQIRTVASNGHRLATVHAAAEIDGDDCTAILPNAAVNAMIAALKQKEDAVLEVGGRLVGLACGNTRLTAKLIDGQYPNWRRVTALKRERHIRVDVPELCEAVESCAAVSRDASVVKISGETDSLRLEIMGGDRIAEATVPAKMDGPVTVGFNWRYLTEALKGLDGELDLCLADNGALLVETDDRMAVVMPVRL